MTKTVPKPNFTQSPNVFYDEWLPRIASLAEMKVVNVVIRHTFGWHNQQVKLSLTDLVHLTGLSEPSVIEGVRLALDDGYIEREKEGQSWCYKIAVESASTPKESLGVESESPEESLGVTPKDSLGEPLKNFKEQPLKNFKGYKDKEKEKEKLNKEGKKKTSSSSLQPSPDFSISEKKIPLPDPFPIADALRAWAAEKAPLVDLEDETDRFILRNNSPPKNQPNSPPPAQVPVPLSEWIRRWQVWIRKGQQYADRDAKLTATQMEKRNDNGADHTNSRRSRPTAAQERNNAYADAALDFARSLRESAGEEPVRRDGDRVDIAS